MKKHAIAALLCAAFDDGDRVGGSSAAVPVPAPAPEPPASSGKKDPKLTYLPVEDPGFKFSTVLLVPMPNGGETEAIHDHYSWTKTDGKPLGFTPTQWRSKI